MSNHLQRIALIRSVVDKYHEEDKSLRRTSASMGLSVFTTRKMLITARAYDSPRKREIDLLREQGLSVQQIAERLGVSTSAVGSFVPYARGTYLIPSQTINAKRVRECRSRKEAADMPTDAQRRAQDKWDRENMAHINCKMRRDIAEEFKAAAKANGTTPNALIRAWIDGYIQSSKPTE